MDDGDDSISINEALVLSMCCPLMNIIKTSINNPSKNMVMAKNENLVNVINILGEKLLPQYLYINMDNT